MNVVWTKQAQDDLKAIHAFIARDSVYYAAQVVETLLAVEATIAAHPTAGTRVREFLRPDIRQVRRYSYRIIYRVRARRIEVLTIVHSKRLLGVKESDT